MMRFGWLTNVAAVHGASLFGSVNQIRNNSMSGAVNGSPGTIPTNWAIANPTGLTRTITVGTQVDGPYTVNTIDFNFAGTATSTAQIIIAFEGNQQIAALTGQQWNLSSWLQVPVDNAALTTLSLITAERTAAGAGVSSTSAGNFYSSRASFGRRNGTATLIGGVTTAFVTPRVDTNSITSGTVIAGLTIRIGWPQIEQASSVGLPKVTP